MYQNGGCCTPQSKNINSECCCKNGILCALDWFYQDFLLKGQKCIKDLKYYPILPNFNQFITGTEIDKPISNIIYNIPYITQDIVPIYTNTPVDEPYKGNITYLNICKIEGFEFKINSTNCTAITKESDIASRFCKISYSSPCGCCCKNGTLEYLLKAKDFLLNVPSGTLDSVVLSTQNNSFEVTQILAVNPDTVWAKNDKTLDNNTPVTTYYVLSLCELIGISLNRV
ncbi:hypothetical protein [Romboutsia lituseburensis]|uniref:hypothetical protein n=1 Tax=Romboutsia lituseburensis TaxID=1537 RepID=UPI00215B6EB6|nr:hypothetical protein [Romboutsia lituseburensis]MCR8744603.1 hypothetical protein [Romboutsia lituseburensis]